MSSTGLTPEYAGDTKRRTEVMVKSNIGKKISRRNADSECVCKQPDSLNWKSQGLASFVSKKYFGEMSGLQLIPEYEMKVTDLTEAKFTNLQVER